MAMENATKAVEDIETDKEENAVEGVEGYKEESAGAKEAAVDDIETDEKAGEKDADEKVPVPEDADRGKAALTSLFEEVRTQKTPIIVARVVADIDAIVKPVRFDGWQRSTAGERDVKQALRKALLQYKLHSDQELFDRAYGYIKQYY